MAAAKKAAKKARKTAGENAKRGRWGPAQALKFARGIVDGLPRTQALIAAWPQAAQWSQQAIRVQASKRAREPAVQQAIAAYEAETKAAVIAAGAIDLQTHLAELARLRDLAVAGKDYGAAIRAEERRGMAAGFYVERKQVAHTGTITHVDRAVSEVDALMAEALRPGQTFDNEVDGQERSLLPAPVPAETPRH